MILRRYIFLVEVSMLYVRQRIEPLIDSEGKVDRNLTKTLFLIGFFEKNFPFRSGVYC